MKSNARIDSTKRPHRWTVYSLRTLLLIVTIVGVWIGVQVNSARRQADTVAAIVDAGGRVVFDYQLVFDNDRGPGRFKVDWDKSQPTPAWLRRLFGDDCFRTAVGVTISHPDDQSRFNRFLDQALKLPALRRVSIAWVYEEDERLEAVRRFFDGLLVKSDLDELEISIDGADPRGPNGEQMTFDRWFVEQKSLRELRQSMQRLYQKFGNAQISGYYEANDVGSHFY